MAVIGGAEVDTKIHDIGDNHKTSTTEGSGHNTAVGSGNTTTDIGSGNTAHTAVGNGNQAGSVIINDHHDTYIGVPPAAAQAAHDPAEHEAAAVHHGGYHADPTVLALQQRLLENGFDPGALDGVMGPHTEAALAAEQAFWAHQQQAEHGGHGEHHPHHQYGHESYPHAEYGTHHSGHEGYGYEHGGYEGYGHEGYPPEQYHHDANGHHGHGGYHHVEVDNYQEGYYNQQPAQEYVEEEYSGAQAW